MYKEMVLYIEACESGSMFENILEDNLNVYAVTAANSKESSWGTYCPPQDTVQGKHMQTCLGDLFSVNWMENADLVPSDAETLDTQFDIILKETSKSHVMRFGDTTFTNEVIGNFEGSLDEKPTMFESLKLRALQEREPKDRAQSAVSSRDAKLNHLYARVMEDGSHKAHLDLSVEVNKRMTADHVFEKFAQGFPATGMNEEFPNPTNFDCLRTLMDTYEESCGRMDDYSLKYVKYLVKECESMPETYSLIPSMDRIRAACQE